MAESLLAGLHTRFKCSQEDIATISLHYILSSSDKLNAAFNNLLSASLKIDLESDIKYSYQQSGEDKERPDMSGFDDQGNEVVVCEMKFYAVLTPNQPNGYLDRLKRSGGKALVFVCPENRKISLWRKIKELCEEQNRTISVEDGYRVIVDGITMSIITWDRIINILSGVASSDSAISQSDIDQLAGFCSMMDSIAFLPFTPEDMDPMIARKENRHYEIIEELFEVIKSNPNRNIEINERWKAGPSRGGFSKKIIIDGYDVILIYDRFIWMDSTYEDTPFWFYIADNNWKQSDELKKQLKSLSDPNKYSMKYTYKYVPSALYDAKLGAFFLFALHPKVDATLDEVTEDLMNQILSRIDCVKNLMAELNDTN